MEPETITILMADDDEEDCFLAKEALSASGQEAVLLTVEDGVELMEFLSVNPRPDIILLDLNMPRKDGREVLTEIRADASLSGIPVVILSTSGEEEDISFSKGAGADLFLTKPPTFNEWVEIMGSLIVNSAGLKNLL